MLGFVQGTEDMVSKTDETSAPPSPTPGLKSSRNRQQTRETALGCYEGTHRAHVTPSWGHLSSDLNDKKMPRQEEACQAEGKQVHGPRGRKGRGLCEEQREASAAEAESARRRRPTGEVGETVAR